MGVQAPGPLSVAKERRMGAGTLDRSFAEPGRPAERRDRTGGG